MDIMPSYLKKIIIVLAIIAVPVIFLRASGCPGAGEKASERIGLPHHAVLAHRGLSYYAPEETVPSYRLALEAGADYLEGDIQRTKDGALVMLHDDTLERTTDVAARFPDRKGAGVSAFTLNELKQLDAGSCFDVKNPGRARVDCRGLRIITLDEMVSIAEEGKPRPGLYLESKSPENYPGIERAIVSLLNKRGWIGQGGAAKDYRVKARVIFQSFDLSSLERFSKEAPGVPRIYLVDENDARRKGWDTLVSDAARVGSGLGPSGYAAYPWRIGSAHRKGLVVHVYTLNPAWQMRIFTFLGADGIFTDRCDILLRQYGR